MPAINFSVWEESGFLNHPNFYTGLAAQTAPKQKSRTTKSPLMQNWVFRLGLCPNLTTRCQEFELKLPDHFVKLLTNLAGWKVAYLISQLRTGIWRKLFWLKTCSQGVLQAQRNEIYFFPLPTLPVRLKIHHLKWMIHKDSSSKFLSKTVLIQYWVYY